LTVSPDEFRGVLGRFPSGVTAVTTKAPDVSATPRFAFAPLRTEELDQHRLRVVEREDILQMRHQNVVQAGEKSPHEEKRRHRSQRSAVALPSA